MKTLDYSIYSELSRLNNHRPQRYTTSVPTQPAGFYLELSPMKEQWKPVVGNKETHLVSSNGRVFSKILNRELIGYIMPIGYRSVSIRRKQQYVHKLVAEAFIGKRKDGYVVDHINQIKTDNRIENIRYITHRENLVNTGIPKSNTSGYKGVCFDKTNKKWKAYTNKGEGRVNIGTYRTKQEAINAVKNKGQNQ